MQQHQEELTDDTAEEWIRKNQKQILPKKQSSEENKDTQSQFEKSNALLKEKHLQKAEQFSNDSYFINFYTSSSNDKIRERFYSKLALAGLMKDTPTKKHQNLFIFDWDDTILCTTYLSSFQFLDIPVEAKDTIKKIDEIAQKLLKTCVEKEGEIYIITNAAKGWVEYSSKIYLPKVNALLTAQKVKIISARSLFAEQFPGDYAKWKTQAFKSILSNFNTYMITNLICLGDSTIEMDAAQSLGKEFQESLVKTVKFKENPKPDQLIKQLQLVSERMKEIYSTPKNLTIRLERKQQKTKQ